MNFAKGWKEIGTVFGVSGKEVKAWYADGAPILILGEKPVAELGGLWRWLLELHGKDARLASVAQVKTK